MSCWVEHTQLCVHPKWRPAGFLGQGPVEAHQALSEVEGFRMGGLWALGGGTFEGLWQVWRLKHQAC